MSSAIEVNGVTLATLAFRGRDAAGFLQGQLSNDVQSLVPGAGQLAGYHNPQGRVIALLRLARPGPEELHAQLPAELAEAVAARLRRFVLRSRVTIEVLEGATRPRLDDIAAGLPQVYAATSERFVAQMLNLDCVGAIAFDKGCYTGQEVIARAHYRGRVKRRMQRFATRTPQAAPLQPGAAVRLADGRRFEVVDAAARPDGRIEFLAVGPLPGAHEEAPAQEATVPPAVAADTTATPGAGEAPPLDCEPLPLPYALPD